VKKQVILNRRCFKIDKANAKAIIDGFVRDGIKEHQSIYCFTREMQHPELITLDKGVTRFTLSTIGEALNSENYSIPYRYVAEMIEVFHVSYESKIWEELCHNGLFDIWDPIAPYLRFRESKRNPEKFSIGLFRVYEIEEEFSEAEIEKGDRHHMLKRRDLAVTCRRPLLKDAEFEKIHALLKSVAVKYLI